MKTVSLAYILAACVAPCAAFLPPAPRRCAHGDTRMSAGNGPVDAVQALAKRILGPLSVLTLGAAPLGGLVAPQVAHADGATTKFRLPPIDNAKKDRCTFRSSAMGQANAARDSLYDLRLCDMSGKAANGFDLSGAIMSEADFHGVNFKEAVMSKAYAQKSNFEGADFTSAVVDRVSFDGSKMKGAVFTNAVLSGTSFTNADLEDSDFTDVYIGQFDLNNLCRNPSLKGTNPVTGQSTKESAGCR